MKQTFSNALSSIKTFGTFALWFVALVVAFTALANPSVGAKSGLEKVIAFGASETYPPLAFSFVLGVGAQFLTRRWPKAFRVANWICSFGRDGILVFFSLIFGLVIGTWSLSLLNVLGLCALALFASIIVMAVLEALALLTNDRIFRLILGYSLVTSAFLIPSIVP